MIEIASRQIKQAFQRRLQQGGFDLTVDQWVVLEQLSAGPKSQVQVVEAVYKDPPTVTRIVDVLCRKGLAQRRPDEADRRRFSLHLTGAGTELLRRLQPVVVEVRARGWQGLTPDDYQQLHRIMTTVLGNFDREAAATLSGATAFPAEGEAA